jgi:spore maturation protein CgeB
MRIVYSFNKTGEEAQAWMREIAAASTDSVRFIPFNHDPYVSTQSYIRAQLLDNLFYASAAGLTRLYRDITELLRAERADALIVDTCPPYHPEFLRTLPVYKVLRIADGPASSYDRDFAYLHAYDHVLYHSPAYSRDLNMREKLAYCGCNNADLWPHALFESMYNPTHDENSLFSRARDIDIIFVGALFTNKMPLLAALKREFGKRFVLHGLTTWKRNLYFNVKYRIPSWVTPITNREYAPLYQRAKIGVNIHNRGKYTVGSYRLFDLPGNGVMQLSDGDEFLSTFFDPGKEIASYRDTQNLIDQLHYYLSNDDERIAIARAGYRRTMRDHRLSNRLLHAADLIQAGMSRKGRNA